METPPEVKGMILSQLLQILIFQQTDLSFLVGRLFGNRTGNTNARLLD
jgi:hypothetical protein